MCAVLAVLALASCGQQDDSGSASETPKTEASSSSPASPSKKPGEKSSKSEDTKPPPGTPDCADVWKKGAMIPRTYQGCADNAGAYVERDTLACSSGQRMVRYADRFWGVLGGTVNEANGSLDGDHDYKVSMRNCSA